MRNTSKGFTLIELMIVVVIIGILAAIGIPNFIEMQYRAKEGSTKANMHTFQLAAEDWGVKHDGIYAAVTDSVALYLPVNFKNPFDQTTGDGNAYKSGGANKAGIVGYAGGTTTYSITGGDKQGNAMTLTLSSGS